MPGENTPRKEDEERLPPSSYDLIRYLDRAVPAEGIRKGESPEDAHRRAGQREVVQQLVDWMNEELAEINAGAA